MDSVQIKVETFEGAVDYDDNDTVYEGPALHEISLIRDAVGWDLAAAKKNLRKKLGKTKFTDVFYNKEESRAEIQEWLDAGIPAFEEIL